MEGGIRSCHEGRGGGRGGGGGGVFPVPHLACDVEKLSCVENMAVILRGKTSSLATTISSACRCHHWLPHNTISPLQYLAFRGVKASCAR